MFDSSATASGDGIPDMPILAVLLTLMVFLAPNSLCAKEFRFDYQKILQTGREAELDLTYVSGNLEVISTDGDRVIIEAVKKVNAVSMDEAEMVADHIEIKVLHDKKKVKVVTNYLQMRNRSQSFWQKVLGVGGSDSFGEVDWRVQVPQGCRISICNTSGAVSISHIEGNVDIRSSSADIQLLSVEGDVNVEAAAGTTVGELLFGSVTVRQAQGRIDLKFVEGDIRIKAASADIEVHQDRGSIDLSTTTGDARVQTNLDSSRDYFFETETGNLSVTIPETSSGNIRIESQTGDIQTDMPIAIKSMNRRQLEGSFGSGGVKVSLISISGDVTIAQF